MHIAEQFAGEVVMNRFPSGSQQPDCGRVPPLLNKTELKHPTPSQFFVLDPHEKSYE
jgi:hypothetical protein